MDENILVVFFPIMFDLFIWIKGYTYLDIQISIQYLGGGNAIKWTPKNKGDLKAITFFFYCR
jgi:hypothetical protein